MEIQKTTGIVLSSKKTGESDYICPIFTRDFGKRDFVFKGLQKSRKRPQIVSESGTTVNIIYYYHESRNSFIVNDFQILKDTNDLRSDLKKIYLLYYLVNLIEKTTGYNDKNIPVYSLLAAGIDQISKEEHHGHLSVFFALHLMKLHGILPDFFRCKTCGGAESDFYLDTFDFHPVCSTCRESVRSKTIFLNRMIKKFIHESLSNKFTSINHSYYPSDNITNFLFSLTLFIENYYHIEIKSKDMLIRELSY
jgi:DNA repair protein RecO (recombination protein O)